jgi:thiopeptide-type bacteriocin biosynthesis protein
MKPRVISSFLLRAPLLPVSALRRPAAALRAHPLGPEALALASPDLAAGLARGGKRAQAAVDRYARRAAFRPTPHGLLAGVMVGTLGARTSIATGAPRAERTIGWARLAALGRELLDDPETRARVNLRAPPSLLIEGAEAAWLSLPAEGALEVKEAQLDTQLAAVLAATEEWTPWSAVRAVAAAASDEVVEEDELDDYLLVLVDQGLLHFDLCPPLVGRPPLTWMQDRLATLETDAATAARARLETPTTGMLVHQGKVVLSRTTVERAAALAPLLFRLQEALSPPAAERALGVALDERLESIAELHGAGPYDAAALATGAHGPTLAFLEEDPPHLVSPPPPLLAHLAAALTACAREGSQVLDLDPDALEALLPATPPPPTFELVLTPTASPAKGGKPGGGRRSSRPAPEWLLGLHAPAGASWGRYAHAVGDPLTQALAELTAAESAAGDPTVDVTFAPSAALADLCVHPPARGAALALVSWPEGRAIPAQALLLHVDPSAPLALSDGPRPLRPSPLHRVRSTTVPPGLFRMIAGWSFVRQHAPWAFGWGALGDLPRLPRVRLGDFVVAPASWRVPGTDTLAGRGLRRWRAEAEVPRHVQVGEGDELLLVDLEAPGAAADLARHAGGRAFEVWPPLEALADEGGRRVEAVVAVVSDELDDEALAAPEQLAVGTSPAEGWTTYKLFGAEERQDEVLLAAVLPLVTESQAAGIIQRWHFLRYVEGGTRDHLRLRARATDARAGELFARSLRVALAPVRESADVVEVETAEYFPELARYGGAATFALVERLFELDSELVLRLLSVAAEAPDPPDSDRLEWLVRAFDALARGLGLDLAARQTLAQQRRRAHLADPPAEIARALDAHYRARQRRLAALLAGTASDVFSAPLDAHATRVQALAGELSPEVLAALIEVLPPVLHLDAVRLVGARPDDEAAAYLFWERALEGLAARRRRAGGVGSPPWPDL